LRQSGANVQLKAFIGLSGPYDLPLDDPRVVDKFASVGDGRDAKPFRLATAVTPPTLLLHGEADDLVGPEQSERLAERLRELGVPVTLRLYEDTDHIDIVLGLAKLLRHKNPAYRHTARFLHSQGLTRPCTDNR
jgi:acetyl esterase/lipase